MKVKTLVLLSSIFMLGLWSCSDDKDVVNPDPDTNPEPEEVVNKYITGEDLSKSYSLSNKHEVGHSKFKVLGYGYDVTGKFAHPAWIKASVIDIEKMAREEEYSIEERKPYPSIGLGIMFGTRWDVLDDICGRRNVLIQEKKKYPNKIFGSMFTLPFENDTSFKDIEYYYSSLSSITAVFQFELRKWDYYKEGICENYLSKGFSDDLILLTGKEIITKYGTHILAGVVLGQRNDYIYRSSSPRQLQEGVIARPEEVFGKKPIAWMSAKITDDNKKENVYHEMVGSKAPKTNAWMVDYTNLPKDNVIEVLGFGETSEEDAVFVDFPSWSSVNSLIPIYEVIQDETKREEVQEAFEKYLSE